jgi:hypothetical protein
MTLINEGASFPSYIWAVVRFLLSADGQYPVERARTLLCPTALLPEETRAKDGTFSQAVRTLQDLGLVTVNGDDLSLAPAARGLSPGDLAGFSDLLRLAVLDPDRNASLAEKDDQAGSKDTGPKDLVRALAWFLTLDAFTPLGLDEVTQLQESAFPSRLGNPIVNNVRWNRFAYWAPALGFATAPLLEKERQGQRPVQKLVPDCTEAVRRTVLAAWQKGERIDAADAVDHIIEELPVLPGGRYSRLLGLPASRTNVASSLSFALLCGDQDWISLGRRSDAARDVFVTDPDAASGTRRISEITITGTLDD